MSAFSLPVKRLYFPSLHKPLGYPFLLPLLPAGLAAAKPSTIAEIEKQVQHAFQFLIRRPVRDGPSLGKEEAGSSGLVLFHRCGSALQRWRNTGLRLETKASMPSFWSSVANSEWNTRRSNRMPSASGTS